MSQSFVSNIMMSVRAGDNKADYSTYHTSNKLNHRFVRYYLMSIFDI